VAVRRPSLSLAAHHHVKESHMADLTAPLQALALAFLALAFLVRSLK
jgi:hypothetical protein